MEQEYPDHITLWHFDFTRAFIGTPVIELSEIRIPIEKFGILKGVLGITVSTFFLSATLIYEDVVASRRTITRYADETETGFGEETEIVDGPFKESYRPMFLHRLQLVLKEPSAWVDWEIIAGSVRVEDKKPLK